MLKDLFKISVSNLSRRRLRSWLTIIGVIIGIAAVIALIGIGEGLRSFVSNQFNIVGADVLRITAKSGFAGPPGAGVVNPLTDNDLNSIRNVKGVKTAVGRIIQIGFMEFNKKRDVVYFFSVPNSPYRKDVEQIFSYTTSSGRLLKDGEKFAVVVGADFTDAERFGKPVKVGDRIFVNNTAYTVVGILKKRGSFIVDQTILMNEDQMRQEFGIQKDRFDTMGAQVDKGINPNEIKVQIEKVLRKNRNVKEGEEDFEIQTAESALKNLNSTLFAINLFVIIIAGISILVGGIGITNTMFTSILERTNEIGIMKAIGARNSTIFKIFLTESGLIGLVGGAIGILFGTILAEGLAFGARIALKQDMLQANISIYLVFGALFFSFIIGSLSGFLPAYRASKLNPVEAIAYKK